MRQIISSITLVGATLILSTVVVAVSLFDKHGEQVHKIARFWAKIFLKAAGITVSLEGRENIGSPPYVLVSNHQSALDIFVLLAAVPLSFKFIAKQQLFRIPVFGWCMKKAGYVSIDRDNPREALRAIEKAAGKIAQGTTVLIFPEGTRSPDGKLLPFKKGTFSLVSRAKVPVVPLAIIGTNALQPPGAFVPRRTGHVILRAGNPILSEGKGLSYKAGLMEDVRATIERLLGCPTT